VLEVICAIDMRRGHLPLDDMRIVCPSCSAAYDVPDSRVLPGRVVRCARCAQEWAPVDAAPPQTPEPPQFSPEPITPEDAPPPIATIRQSAMDRLAAHPARPPSKSGLKLAWAASIFVIVLALVGAFAWRSSVVAAWPPSERVYALFGLQRG
jgi:predicted Zn finger-like uncharacterized protein